jgi:hypothetical protein
MTNEELLSKIEDSLFESNGTSAGATNCAEIAIDFAIKQLKLIENKVNQYSNNQSNKSDFDNGKTIAYDELEFDICEQIQSLKKQKEELTKTTKIA